MSEYRRTWVPGGTYFITVVTYRRRAMLTSDPGRACLRAAWRITQARRPFRLEAVCVLPDHFHCLLSLPESDRDLSIRVSVLKGVFTKQYLLAGGSDGMRNCSRFRSGEAAIWQRRFWEHCICNDTDFANHIDYIHYNPVKHGLVSSAAEWRWSTFARFHEKGYYASEWGSSEPESLRGFVCGNE